MADEAGKDRSQEVHSPEYQLLGKERFAEVCKTVDLDDQQAAKVEQILTRLAGVDDLEQQGSILLEETRREDSTKLLVGVLQVRKDFLNLRFREESI